jgi:hypothetical protein
MTRTEAAPLGLYQRLGLCIASSQKDDGATPEQEKIAEARATRIKEVRFGNFPNPKPSNVLIISDAAHSR